LAMSYEGSEYSEYEQQPEAEERNEVSLNTSQDICRDFLHGRCSRSACKYKHDTAEREIKLSDSPVCKDYQSSMCHRQKCKYLHLTKDEEEQFKITGVMPEKNANENFDSPGVELCRDFKKGVCTRGNSCKYLHQADESNGGLLNILGKRPSSAVANAASELLYNKRPNSASGYLSTGSNGSLEQENEALQKEVLELRKQVLQLQQQNDALLRKQQSANTVMNDYSNPNPYSQNGYSY